ncbi:TetR/AcrR family transcriptional regulator [Nesterenkonia ebinurensis]|uniref:TetR/AcrR family transcriptional regulator n=1 Tax=Nesterenkonia ebinurensis TaxID=2608252 RepID=UPI00123CA87C|nr:TetR/AcrR family transcriptional regulator [Nesterenkonia ebinurensis]
MGHREALLEGAKRCLYDKGYARTTARDLVAASGTNLGSIGYHYGTKEALLDAALLSAVSEMNAALLQHTQDEHARGAFPAAWQRIIDTFAEYRPLLIAQVEAWAQVERSPELRERLAAFQTEELARGSEHARTLHPALDEPTARAVTAVTNILADGLVVQWLIDPDTTPTGADIATGLRALADVLDENDERD